MAEETNKNKKHFFKDMKTELKKVNWLTPKQLLNNTTAVIVMVVIVAAIVFVLDLTFDKVNEYGVEGLKAVVQKDENTVNSEENTGDEDNTVESEENSEGEPTVESENEEENPETESGEDGSTESEAE